MLARSPLRVVEKLGMCVGVFQEPRVSTDTMVEHRMQSF